VEIKKHVARSMAVILGVVLLQVPHAVLTKYIVALLIILAISLANNAYIPLTKSNETRTGPQ